MKIHIANVHEKEKPHECNICGAKFTQKISLKVHIDTIHGGKLVRCNVCDRKFSKSNLDQHVKSTHEKSKHFNCEICESGFGTKRDLNRHIAFVHENRKPLKPAMTK